MAQAMLDLNAAMEETIAPDMAAVAEIAESGKTCRRKVSVGSGSGSPKIRAAQRKDACKRGAVVKQAKCETIPLALTVQRIKETKATGVGVCGIIRPKVFVEGTWVVYVGSAAGEENPNFDYLNIRQSNNLSVGVAVPLELVSCIHTALGNFIQCGL